MVEVVAIPSKLLHQVLPHRPHSRSLSIDIHGYGEEHAPQLYAADGQEGVLSTAGLEPMWKEQRKDKPMKNICVRSAFFVSRLKGSTYSCRS